MKTTVGAFFSFNFSYFQFKALFSFHNAVEMDLFAVQR